MKIEDILSKLISYPTLSSNKEAQIKAFDWIEKKLKSLALYIKRLEYNRVSSLIITTKRTKKPILWLAAHIDVVSASPHLFNPRIKDGRLYGRGAFDMKFAPACYIKLLKDLGPTLGDYNFGVMLTADEELGGWKGTKRLLEKGYISQVCLLPDGGKNWQIERSAKGVWHLHFISIGKSAHGAKPWKGRNAIVRLSKFLLDLSTAFPEDKYHKQATMNIGKIQGGRFINQVPDLAEAFVDIRFPDELSRRRIERLITNLKRKYRGIKSKTVLETPSYRVDFKNKYLKMFMKIVKDKTGITMQPVDSHGTSDGRFFASKGIPVILTRPKGGGHHTEKEWIDIKSLNLFYSVLKEFTQRVSRVKE